VTDNNFINVTEGESMKGESTIYSYFDITDLGAKRIVHTSEKKNINIKRFKNDEIKFNFEISDPKLWSPDDPNMYMVSVYLGKANDTEKESDFHRYDMPFGFRELKISGNQFLLNGQKFYAKGVSRYEDVKGMGNSITYSMMKKEIEKIKNLGSNMLYCNAVAPHPYIMDLCDRYGLFVLQEIPINSAPAASLRDREFVGKAVHILRETVNRDRNRPSLFAVGMGFGYNVYDLQTVDFIKDLSDKSREFDDELFTFITSEFTEYEEYYKLTDFNILSIGSNTRDPDYKTSLSNIFKKALSKPVIVNNRLTRVYPGNQNGYDDPYSEPSQAKQLLDSYILISEDENISGIIIDSFRDRRSEVSLLTNRPGDDLHTIRNGLIDYEGNERLSYRFLDALFKTRKTPALAQGEYNPPEVNIYFILGLFLTVLYLYMIKREHYLFINSVRSIKNPDAFFIDIRDRRITQVLQAFFIGTLSAYGISAVFSTVFYSFRQHDRFDFFLTYFIRNDLLKKFITFCSWEPLIFIVSSTILILVFNLLTAIFIKVVSIFFNHRYSLPIAISMVLWNSIVFLPLVPVSAIFLRIFSPASFKFVLIIYILMAIWFVIRLFLIMSVSFKTSLRKVLWVNLLMYFALGLLWLYFFDLNTDRFSYFFYLVDLLIK
jgi:beta-galactosidase